MNIEQIIIPAAGLGTRFLPFTKAVAKEMIPLLERPAIEYTLEEATKSGISRFTCISNNEKTSLHNHLNLNAAIKSELRKKNKEHLIEQTEQLLKNITIDYVMQHEQNGLGHAILQTKHHISPGQSFGVMLPDDIIIGSEPEIARLMRTAQRYNACVIAVQEVPYDAVSQYGIVSTGKERASGTYNVNGLVEKPAQADAPSNLAIIGRYILPYAIFEALENTAPSKNNEIQITDAIQHLIKQDIPVIACKIHGTRYDIGTPLGWCKALIDLAYDHPSYGPEVRAYIRAKSER